MINEYKFLKAFRWLLQTVKCQEGSYGYGENEYMDILDEINMALEKLEREDL